MLCKKVISQSMVLVGLALVLAFAVNGLRPDGLPLVHARESAIEPTPAGAEISIQDAALLYASGRGLFLDARSVSSFTRGHIQKALSLPVQSFTTRAPALSKELKTAATLITYCSGEHCPLAQELAELLIEEGYRNVRVLKNGWSQWQQENLPIVENSAQGAGEQ